MLRAKTLAYIKLLYHGLVASQAVASFAIMINGRMDLASISSLFFFEGTVGTLRYLWYLKVPKVPNCIREHPSHWMQRLYAILASSDLDGVLYTKALFVVNFVCCA